MKVILSLNITVVQEKATLKLQLVTETDTAILENNSIKINASG